MTMMTTLEVVKMLAMAMLMIMWLRVWFWNENEDLKRWSSSWQKYNDDLFREQRYTEIREASGKIQNILEENSRLFKVDVMMMINDHSNDEQKRWWWRQDVNMYFSVFQRSTALKLASFLNMILSYLYLQGGREWKQGSVGWVPPLLGLHGWGWPAQVHYYACQIFDKFSSYLRMAFSGSLSYLSYIW